MSMGWNQNKVVFGLITNPANGPGHVEWARQEGVLRALRQKYPNFGGVMGWEYFNSLPGDSARPWEWAANMARTIRTPLPTPPPIPIRPYGQPAQLPQPPHSFPAESVQTLKDLGFTDQQAVAALNSTGGNVEYAAAFLFQD